MTVFVRDGPNVLVRQHGHSPLLLLGKQFVHFFAVLLDDHFATIVGAIVLGQLANAFACRSETRWVGITGLRGNRLLLGAVAVELVVLLVIPVLVAADATDKTLRGR